VGGREEGKRSEGPRREGSISLLALNGVSLLSLFSFSPEERRGFTSHGRAGVVVTTVQNSFSLISLF
jgi:hypothetical protein